jgi:hypothetical protein
MQIEIVNQDLVIIEEQVVKAPASYPVLKDGDVVETVTYVSVIPLED